VKLQGTAWKFGDSVSTDLIAPGRLFHLRSNLQELAKHVLEDADPEFARKMSPGDFVVAGHNFGLGSSREHAPAIMKMAGIACVVAESFARIFYRNAINVGLPAIQCRTNDIREKDVLEIDLEEGVVVNKTRGTRVAFRPLPPVMRTILEDGGLLPHIRKHWDFKL